MGPNGRATGSERDATDVELGVTLPTIGATTSPSALRGVASAAVETGFDALWAGDHLTFPAEITDDYPFTDSGKAPEAFDARENLFTQLETLSYLAGVTDDIRLGTNVCLAPLRHPLALVKRTFTLEALSKGRLELGVGPGWLSAEYKALGIPFEERGSRLDEFLELFTLAREKGVTGFDGRHHSFDPVGFHPTPSPGRPPLWIGGKSGATFRRVAEYATGWTGVGEDPAAAGMARERLLDAWTDYDRSGSPGVAVSRLVHVGSDTSLDTDRTFVGSAESIREDVRAYADAGVTDVGLMFYTLDIEEQRRQIRAFGDRVIGEL
jgi:probable F420-dependent oxidoreductase